VANPDVAGMGLTLIESHLAIVMTNWFKADVRLQLIDRMHRIGQWCPVTVVDLVTPGTLEPRILRCLRNNVQIEGTVLTGSQLKGSANDGHRACERDCNPARSEAAVGQQG
jgi:SNF2 family DNA or RNA helicase